MLKAAIRNDTRKTMGNLTFKADPMVFLRICI